MDHLRSPGVPGCADGRLDGHADRTTLWIAAKQWSVVTTAFAGGSEQSMLSQPAKAPYLAFIGQSAVQTVFVPLSPDDAQKTGPPGRPAQRSCHWKRVRHCTPPCPNLSDSATRCGGGGLMRPLAPQAYGTCLCSMCRGCSDGLRWRSGLVEAALRDFPPTVGLTHQNVQRRAGAGCSFAETGDAPSKVAALPGI